MHMGTEEPLIGSTVRTNKTVKIARAVFNKHARNAHPDLLASPAARGSPMDE
jgi:hypothetical protein